MNTGMENKHCTPNSKKVEFFILLMVFMFLGSPGTRPPARTKQTYYFLQMLRNFGEIFSFSRFFHRVQNPRSFGWRKKKSDPFHLTKSSAPAKVPSILKTPETDRGDQQLSPEYRDIAQLPIARKLQGFEVGRFGSKSDPKTKTRILDDILGRMSEDEVGLSKASILQKKTCIQLPPQGKRSNVSV